MKSRAQYVQSPLKTGTLLKAVFDGAPPKAIFDIGACEGLDSIRYSRLFPTATVYAFEPLPDNVAKIQETIERFDGSRVRIVNRALSSTNGTAEFHVSGGCPEGRQDETADWTFGNKSSSLIAPNEDEIKKHWPWLEFTGTTKVETVTMDDFCSEEGVTPDFLHMDVQGAELEVLAGAPKMLESISAIWMEVSLAEVYSGQPLADEVAEFMSRHGLVDAVILPEGPQADVLFVRNDLADKVPTGIVEELLEQCRPVKPSVKQSVPQPSRISRVLSRLLHRSKN